MSIRLSDSEGVMAHALDELDKHWQHTAAGWHDSAREDFEKEYIDEMRRSLKAAQRGAKNVNDLLRQVIRECS